MAYSSDLRMARDNAARALNAMKAADAAWSNEASEENNARQAATRKAWTKAVKNVEAVQRKVWAAQSAA